MYRSQVKVKHKQNPVLRMSTEWCFTHFLYLYLLLGMTTIYTVYNVHIVVDVPAAEYVPNYPLEKIWSPLKLDYR